MSRRNTTRLSRVVFGLLVVATFTAFFVAQRLKQTDPLVYAVQIGKFVSPNGDELRDRVRLRFRIKEADAVSVEVIGRDGRSVRTLASERRLGAGSHRFRWNGRDAAGRPVPDGGYRVRITLRANGRSFVPDKTIRVDTTPPSVKVAAAVPAVVPTRGPRRPVRVRYSGVDPANRAEFFVYRIDRGRASRRPVAAFAGSRRARRAYWDLRVGRFVQRKTPCFGKLVSRGRARPAPAGNYVIVVRACDSAGNLGSGPPELPPRRGEVRGRPGVSVRGVELAPAMYPARPGELVTLPLASPFRRHRYRLRSLGGDLERSGRAGSRVLRVRVPAAEPGLYVLTVAAAGANGREARAAAPLVVRGSRKAKTLLVLPAIAWQAQNPVDLDFDGFPETFGNLATAGSVRVNAARPLAGGALPRGLRTREAAVTGSMSGAVERFDATTDYALARAPDAWLRGRKAVVFAGDARWQPPGLGLAVRRFVERGGSVVFFGLDNFRRTAQLRGGVIAGPSPRVQRDVFGEEASIARLAPAPAVPFVDPFAAFSGPVGLFTAFDESRSLAQGARRELAAGRDATRPAVTVYRLGRGRVVRFGTDGWTAALAAGDAGVARATRLLIAEAAR